ncbi:MAG: transglutaminase-like cysteine peptidase [Alphaproteobacteria bacterium]
MLRRATLICLAGFALASTGPRAAGAATPEPLFGTSEVGSKNLAPFPKWQGALERYFAERGLDDGPCQAGTLNRCHIEIWRAEIESWTGLPPERQLDAVNRYMNHAPYIIDPRNYGLEDYWAAPPEFFERDGDCEDYAIAKFMSLRALGWADDALRLVILQDTNLQVAHAVLAAYVDGVPYVLDNQVDDVLPASRIRHYQPLYSINEQGWWLHKP